MYRTLALAGLLLLQDPRGLLNTDPVATTLGKVYTPVKIQIDNTRIIFTPASGPIVEIQTPQTDDGKTMAKLLQDLINLNDPKVDAVLQKRGVKVWDEKNQIFPRKK